MSSLYERLSGRKVALFRKLFSFAIKRQFRGFGRGSSIYKPIALSGLRFIQVGDRVDIREHAWLAAFPTKNGECSLIIRDDTYIGHSAHIVALRSVCIGAHVLIADRVYISDNAHGYAMPGVPVKDQPVRFLQNVEIGDGSWLGEGVCVIGAFVGKHCVIGANSVVTRSIPDYSVAVGAPARVIKRYDFQSGTWKKEGA